MHFIFYHKLISIHAALRQFVFRVDNTMDPAFRSSESRKSTLIKSLYPPTEKLILFQMRKRETESVSFPRQCLKGEVIFRQWPPIKISTVPPPPAIRLHIVVRGDGQSVPALSTL